MKVIQEFWIKTGTMLNEKPALIKIKYQLEPKFKLLIDNFCSTLEIDKVIIFSDTKRKPYSFFRQLLIYFIYEHGYYTVKNLADIFQRDHTTIIYSRNSIKNYLSINDDLTKKYINLLNHLYKQL